MPIYEYQCGNCGHRLEAIQRMSDAPLTECPACGQATLAKQISAAGFRLKGGGWYETDFKQGKQRNVAKAETGADKAGGKEKAGGGDAPKTSTAKEGTAKPKKEA